MNNIKSSKTNGFNFDKMINHIFTRAFMSLFAIVIGCWFWSFSFLSDGFENRDRYYAMKDTVVPVSATVTEINSTKSNYYIYIDYSYNGEEFEDRQWKSTSTKDFNVGDVVEIKINPEYPLSIFSEDDGTSDFITAGIMFSISSAIITAVAVHYVKKRRNCNE